MEQNIETIKNILREGGNIVVLGGINTMLATGLNGVLAEHIAYDIEQKYGYSNDEIVSSPFIARRVELFYRYYKEVILNQPVVPSAIHEGVAKLQRYGKLKAVVAHTVYGLFQKAGCENVIEMHGSVEENRCPICGKKFDSNYIKNAKGVPECDVCEVPLRPGFTLLGEMIDNGRLTQASNAVEGADILLVLGTSLNSGFGRCMSQYYTGDRLILINDREKPGDEKANHRVYGDINDIFAKIMDF